MKNGKGKSVKYDHLSFVLQVEIGCKQLLIFFKKI